MLESSLLSQTELATLNLITDETQKAALKAMLEQAAKTQAQNVVLSEFSKAQALPLPYGKEVKALSHVVNTKEDLLTLNKFLDMSLALGCGFNIVLQAPQGELFQKWNKEIHRGVVASKSELSNK